MSEDNVTKPPETWPAVVWRCVKSPLTGWILLIMMTSLMLVIIFARLSGVDIIGKVLNLPDVNSKWNTNTEPNKPQQAIEDDPLGIVGKWSYETEPLKGKSKAVEGINCIEIDKNDMSGYKVWGQRLFYKDNKNRSIKYPNPIPIKMSRISYPADRGSFSFYFEIINNDEKSKGHVVLQIDKSTPSSMEGVVQYIYADNKTFVANIHYKKMPDRCKDTSP